VAVSSEDPAIKRSKFEPLLTDNFQVVCPADHPLAGRDTVVGNDLAHHPCVTLRRDSGIRAAIDRALYARNIELQIVHETTQVHTALGLVAAGLGITVMPAMLCPAPGDAGLAVRPLRKPRISRRIGLVFSTFRTPSPGALAFAEVFRQVLKAAKIRLPRGVTQVRH
jgi:DNA-binding transcriptional LysR family regulator